MQQVRDAGSSAVEVLEERRLFSTFKIVPGSTNPWPAPNITLTAVDCSHVRLRVNGVVNRPTADGVTYYPPYELDWWIPKEDWHSSLPSGMPGQAGEQVEDTQGRGDLTGPNTIGGSHSYYNGYFLNLPNSKTDQPIDAIIPWPACKPLTLYAAYIDSARAADGTSVSTDSGWEKVSFTPTLKAPFALTVTHEIGHWDPGSVTLTALDPETGAKATEVDIYDFRTMHDFFQANTFQNYSWGRETLNDYHVPRPGNYMAKVRNYVQPSVYVNGQWQTGLVEADSNEVWFTTSGWNPVFVNVTSSGGGTGATNYNVQWQGDDGSSWSGAFSTTITATNPATNQTITQTVTPDGGPTATHSDQFTDLPNGPWTFTVQNHFTDTTGTNDSDPVTVGGDPTLSPILHTNVTNVTSTQQNSTWNAAHGGSSNASGAKVTWSGVTPTQGETYTYDVTLTNLQDGSVLQRYGLTGTDADFTNIAAAEYSVAVSALATMSGGTEAVGSDNTVAVSPGIVIHDHGANVTATRMDPTWNTANGGVDADRDGVMVTWSPTTPIGNESYSYQVAITNAIAGQTFSKTITNGNEADFTDIPTGTYSTSVATLANDGSISETANATNTVSADSQVIVQHSVPANVSITAGSDTGTATVTWSSVTPQGSEFYTYSASVINVETGETYAASSYSGNQANFSGLPVGDYQGLVVAQAAYTVNDNTTTEGVYDWNTTDSADSITHVAGTSVSVNDDSPNDQITVDGSGQTVTFQNGDSGYHVLNLDLLGADGQPLDPNAGPYYIELKGLTGFDNQASQYLSFYDDNRATLTYDLQVYGGNPITIQIYTPPAAMYGSVEVFLSTDYGATFTIPLGVINFNVDATS